MTDLSDKTLEMLLAEATPGPWWTHFNYAGGFVCVNAGSILDDISHNHLEHLSDAQAKANVELAALAPTLATELLSLRKRVKELKGALLRENERSCCGDHGGEPHNDYADCTRCKERRDALREGLPDGDG